ncbi:MAG: zinc ribbon domain-containing protein [Vallitalea sp.]|jgi:hypothetical protein|nr:zinc ribbon domain-containing protein [Vallitalea sp.]
MLFCDTCKNTMVRKIVRNKGKEYIYYICSTYKSDKNKCTNHRIRDKALRKTVLAVLKKQINLIVELDELLNHIEKMPMDNTTYGKVDRRIVAKMKELEKYNNLRAGLYGDFKAGVITKSDYMEMKKDFEIRCNEIEKQILELESRAKELIKSKGKSAWITNFTNNKNITEITRSIIVSLVEKIVVVDKKKIIIHFRFQDEYKDAIEYVESILQRSESKDTKNKLKNINNKFENIKGGV